MAGFSSPVTIVRASSDFLLGGGGGVVFFLAISGTRGAWMTLSDHIGSAAVKRSHRVAV